MLPGEPFVEYMFQIEKAIADRAIPIVVGYANGGAYDVCTAQAHKEGGYEPNMTPLAPAAEPIIVKSDPDPRGSRHRRRLSAFADGASGDTRYYTPSILGGTDSKK